MGVTYLLDTHVFLWLLGTPHEVPPSSRTLLADRANTLLVSAVSAMEVATKVRIGKLPGFGPLVATWGDRVRELRADELPLSTEQALLAGSMNWAHRDPFDRMLAAQSLVENSTLVTTDPALLALPGLRALSW